MTNGTEWTLKRDVGDGKVWKNTLPGMWAWLLQRVSAILILVFLTLHFFLPYRRPIQFLLLAVVAFHACLGIRVFLIDLGANVADSKDPLHRCGSFGDLWIVFCVELFAVRGMSKEWCKVSMSVSGKKQ